MIGPETALVMLLGAAAAQINPVAPVCVPETVDQWTFDRGDQGWVAGHDCKLSPEAGLLRIQATGRDPFLQRAVDLPGGRLVLRMKARGQTGGSGAVYWTTNQSPRFGEDKVVRFPLQHDGKWHESSARFSASGRLTDLRIDPGTAPGHFEIDWIRLVRPRLHPLRIDQVERVGRRVRFQVSNHQPDPLGFSAAGRTCVIGGDATISITRPIKGARPLQAVSLELRAAGLPPVRRTIFVHNPAAETDWVVRRLGDFSFRLARDGSVARIESRGRLVAILGPVVHCQGRLPALNLVDDAGRLRFEGQGIILAIRVADNEISVSIQGNQACEGPVVRALGGLEQGLLAGLEYLGKGESSSSQLDVRTAEHLRFAPDPLKVTMPLMAFVTDRASVAMTWTDMQLQPVFATPNSFDASGDHRMALRGKRIEATLHLGHGALEETIRWAVTKKGLPPLPKPPRSPPQQRATCLAALRGPLKTQDGWGHCAEAKWPRRPFADMASTVWRLTGRVPDLPRFVPGGAHIPNGSIYFVTGRARQWLDRQARQAEAILRRQQPDGSFRYNGRYRRGHFEDTASGVCARPAARLLEYARVTGDRAALRAGVRTLEYIERFRTPRGAQTWEVPLHTPDLLASAYLVWAYVRGYELTGNQEYLECARRWALSGIPFVYLWAQYPIMLYSTPPVFGATNWEHSWFGLPVQWVGIVYAYALTRLAPHDDSLDWNHLARGILISAQQQQYPDGPHVGLLPDSFVLADQRRRPPDINPCALVSLAMVLDGQLDFLSVASGGGHRVAAPFPVAIRNGQAHIRARAGRAYEVIVDGHRILAVRSQGHDVLPLR